MNTIIDTNVALDWMLHRLHRFLIRVIRVIRGLFNLCPLISRIIKERIEAVIGI